MNETRTTIVHNGGRSTKANQMSTPVDFCSQVNPTATLHVFVLRFRAFSKRFDKEGVSQPRQEPGQPENMILPTTNLRKYLKLGGTAGQGHVSRNHINEAVGVAINGQLQIEHGSFPPGVSKNLVRKTRNRFTRPSATP